MTNRETDIDILIAQNELAEDEDGEIITVGYHGPVSENGKDED